MNIVVVGQFSPPVLACMRSWGRSGNKVGFVCIDHGKGITPRSKYLATYMRLPGKCLFKDEGVSRISEFLDQFGADVLSCIDDNIACWLSDNALRFDKKISLAFPSSHMVKTVRSKTLQNKIAANAGLTVLPEYLIDNDNSKSIFISPEHFPLCLRPSEPHHTEPSFKVKLIHSQTELKQFIKTIHIKEKIIGQPFINLPNLVIHGIRSKQGETKRMSAFIVQRKFEGVTLTLKPYSGINNKLLNKCESFVESLDLTGTFHFEFLFDMETNKAFFLELNLRFGGTTAKVLACGYDEPLYALEAFGLVKSHSVPEIENVIVSNKQATLKYIVTAMKNRLTELDYPIESAQKRVYSSLKGLFSSRDEVIDLDDIVGSFSLYGNNIIDLLKRMF